jgi:hypothetical protein
MADLGLQELAQQEYGQLELVPKKMLLGEEYGHWQLMDRRMKLDLGPRLLGLSQMGEGRTGRC